MPGQNAQKKSSEYVRLALPLMTKYNIPITPMNYAVWYAHVSKSNKPLSLEINTMIKSGAPFSKENNQSLYHRFCSEDNDREIRALREDLKKVLTSIVEEVSELCGETGQYQSQLTTSAERLSDDAPLKNIRQVVNELIVETQSIVKYGKTAQDKLAEKTTELEALQSKFNEVKHEAFKDFLTGIANRKSFDENLEQMMQATMSEDDLCLLIIDIDHFKAFNDTHGHIVGDEVLKFVADKIKSIIRGQDFVARFGGEEFAVILPRTDLSGGAAVAENIRRLFAGTNLKTAGSAKPLGALTVSLGAACYQPKEPIEAFVDRSDKALYHAKNNGRNQVATELDLP